MIVLALVAPDGHGHAARSATSTWQLGCREDSNELLVVVHEHLSVADVLCLEDGISGLVECLDGVGIASVAEHLALAQREEVGAAVPLFAQLHPRVVATAVDGLHVPVQVA